jgi:hypothetical protein
MRDDKSIADPILFVLSPHSFNKLVIVERYGMSSAEIKNQRFTAGLLAGVFESFWAA